MLPLVQLTALQPTFFTAAASLISSALRLRFLPAIAASAWQLSATCQDP
jgi:hypothetical protein